MENVDRMLVDYYQSPDFREDLLEWVATPAKSASLRQHIVRQMNDNRFSLGRHLTDEMQVFQSRFITGDMSYNDLLRFVQDYVSTIRVNPR
jgi:hypothetical protein